jgi:hypothetical protein
MDFVSEATKSRLKKDPFFKPITSLYYREYSILFPFSQEENLCGGEAMYQGGGILFALPRDVILSEEGKHAVTEALQNNPDEPNFRE